MEALRNILAGPIAGYILAIGLGALSVWAARQLEKAGASEKLAKVQEQYPIFNVALSLVGQVLKETKYATAYDIAQDVLYQAKVDPSEVRDLAKVMVEEFDVQKYLGTNVAALSPAELKKGEAIARSVLGDKAVADKVHNDLLAPFGGERMTGEIGAAEEKYPEINPLPGEPGV